MKNILVGIVIGALTSYVVIHLTKSESPANVNDSEQVQQDQAAKNLEPIIEEEGLVAEVTDPPKNEEAESARQAVISELQRKEMDIDSLKSMLDQKGLKVTSILENPDGTKTMEIEGKADSDLVFAVTQAEMDEYNEKLIEDYQRRNGLEVQKLELTREDEEAIRKFQDEMAKEDLNEENP